jgi:integrase/recombinase XerD
MESPEGATDARMSRTGPRKGRRRPIDVLTTDDVVALLKVCSRHTSTGIRDRALFTMLFASGLRISEALSLLPRDVDLDALSVTVQSGKGDKRRVVGLLPDAVDPLERWLDRRRTLGIDQRSVLFATISQGTAGASPTRPGRPLAREHVGRVLRRLARRAGILKRVHPHGFRHAHCALLRSRGVDVYQIKTQLGHEHLGTTDRYLHVLGAHELPERLRRIGTVLAPPPDPHEELGDLVARLSARDAAQLVTLLKRAST